MALQMRFHQADNSRPGVFAVRKMALVRSRRLSQYMMYEPMLRELLSFGCVDRAVMMGGLDDIVTGAG